MKRIWISCLGLFFFSQGLAGQQKPPAPPAPARLDSLQPPPPPPPPASPAAGKWWKNSRTARALELTDAQVASLETIFLQHQARLSDLRDDLLKQEEGLRALLEADVLNEAGLMAQREKVLAARRLLELENSDMTLEMRRVLTAAQWRRLENLRRAPLPPPPPPPRPSAKVSDLSNALREQVYDVKATPGLQEPTPLVKPSPHYTPEAKAAKIEGIVLLKAVIAKDGHVAEVEVVRGLGYGLDRAAMDAVRNGWRFNPGMLNGVPVNVRATIEISFRLY
jgi:TonB family protein